MWLHAGTKDQPFGFVEWVGHAASNMSAWSGRPEVYQRGPSGSNPVAPETQNSMTRACYPREGGQRLSARKRSKTEEAGQPERSGKPSASNGKSRKQRSSDLGRALRSIYDDTLREPVPDDFASLIGKLS